MSDYGACRGCDNLRDYGRVCAKGLKLYPKTCSDHSKRPEPAPLPHWVDEPNG